MFPEQVIVVRCMHCYNHPIVVFLTDLGWPPSRGASVQFSCPHCGEETTLALTMGKKV